MYGELDWPGIIANEPQSIVDAAINLYANKEEWQQSQLNGVSIVNTRFNKDNNERKFVNKFSEIIKSLDKHRSTNFTGAMLRHHKMKSTMYMSQWIEAKNKLNG